MESASHKDIAHNPSSRPEGLGSERKAALCVSDQTGCGFQPGSPTSQHLHEERLPAARRAHQQGQTPLRIHGSVMLHSELSAQMNSHPCQLPQAAFLS